MTSIDTIPFRRGPRRRALTVAATLALGGCVSKAEYTTMMMRVDRLEADRQSQAKELQDLRTRGADSSADLDRIRAEMRNIRGQIDERSSPAGRQATQLRGDFNEDLVAQLLEVRNGVIDLEERVGAVEDRLGIPRKAGATGAAPGSPSAPAVAAVAPAPVAAAAQPSVNPYASASPGFTSAPETPRSLDRTGSPAAPAASVANLPSDKQFQAGYNSFQAGRYKEAREAFLAYLAAKPQSDLADDAQYWVGETYYEDRQFEYALPAYDRLIKSYPKSEKVPAALLKQGLCFMALQYNSDAKTVLLKLIDAYPSTDEAKTAREKLKELGGSRR
jgi:tol-pal system protein YbgF